MPIAVLAVTKHTLHNGLKKVRHASHSVAQKSTSTSNPNRHPDRSVNALPSSKPQLTYTLEQRPKPINITTFTPTKWHAFDRTHPFHIKVNRKLAAFDSSKFYWRVRVTMDMSKKASVRRWMMKRMREAFKLELKSRGFKRDGTRHDGSPSALRGALMILVPKTGLLMSYEDIATNVKTITSSVFKTLKIPEACQARSDESQA